MKKAVTILFVFIFFSISFAQDTTITITPQSKIDSLKLAYHKEDSLKTKSSSEVDTLIDYGGEIMETLITSNKIKLTGTAEKPAWVLSRDMTLKAHIITIDNDSNMLFAEGILDTTGKSDHPDSVKYIGLPVFEQGGEEPMYGFKMVYNLNTRKGRVLQGRTKHQGGYYLGDNIVRVEKNVLQITDGKFTTCDKEDHPHFYFQGEKMKFKVRDKVVTKPVLLFIEDVPVFWLPYGVFPARGGRRSGILTPSYGSSQSQGRYLRGLGYYFALSDYYDAKIITDYYDKGGLLFRGDIRYKKRYELDGYLSGSYSSPKLTGSERWDLTLRHSHIVDPTLRIGAQANFQSDKDFYKTTSYNMDKITQQRMYSAIQISKNWEGTNNSMTINISQDKDIDDGSVTNTFPQITFNRSSPTYLFKRKGKAGRGSKSKWYESINFRYSSNLLRMNSKKYVEADTTYDKSEGFGIEHKLNFSAPQKIMKYIAMNPSISYKENWYNEHKKKYLDENGEETEEDVKGFIARRTFSTGVSFNTNLYGVFPVNIGALKIIRHKMTPSISLSYTPDFSDEQFGYYDYYTDSLGVKYWYDKFEDVVIGGRTPSRRSRSMSLRLGNLIQVKTVKGEEEKKFDIFLLDFSTSYNFEYEKRKLGDLSTSFRLKRYANFDVRMTHSFYKYDFEKGEVSEDYLWKDGSFLKKRFIRLTNLKASIGFTKKGGEGKKEKEESEKTEEEPVEVEEEGSLSGAEDPQSRFGSGTNLAQLQTPWSLSANFNFNLRKPTPLETVKNFTGNCSFEMQLTKNWKMSYQTSFDIVKKEITTPKFNFYRDLHCWEFSFEWWPLDSRRGFYFVLRIKDPQFRDLKVEKHGGEAYIGN